MNTAYWETVIGLEVHVELSTQTKIFCSCTTRFGGSPNTHCCPVCMGLPGTLPVLNERVLEYAVRAGLALNCTIEHDTRFDRKNYFYPDLPKAYQISQLYRPVAREGSVEIHVDGVSKTIRIHEMHMEEDAGKLIHSETEHETWPDYNRCGVPLLEIVSEPDFRSAAEVTAYLEKIRSVFTYLGISDCKMQEGSMRADVNLSVRPKGSSELGTRTEMKNINSIRAIEHAIANESARQIRLLLHGETVRQETRHWDEERRVSTAMRGKENAPDYRYFPDPDLPPVLISETYIGRIRDALPEFAEEKQSRFRMQYQLSDYDAGLLTASRAQADLFEAVVKAGAAPKDAANWFIVHLAHVLKQLHMSADELQLTAEPLAYLIQRVESGEVNRPDGLEVLTEMVRSGNPAFDVAAYIDSRHMAVQNDETLLQEVIQRVIADNPKAVGEYRGGKTKAIGFLVGQALKELQGKSNPALVRERMAQELDSQS